MILTAVVAIGGVLIAIVLDELGIIDLVKYDKENVIGEAGGSAGLSDWLRWTLMGYIVLGILLLLSTFGSALGDEWTSWSAAKDRLRRERIAEDEQRNREHAERLERMDDERENEDATSPPKLDSSG